MKTVTSAPHREQELLTLLAEEPDRVRARRQRLFDELLGEGSERSLVLMGAGSFGKRVLSALRMAGENAVAFCDNNPAVQGSVIDGLPVLPVAEAVRRFGSSSAFVLTIFNPLQSPAAGLAQLKGFGATRVMTVVPVAWKFPQSLVPAFFLDLPERIVEARGSVLEAFRLLADDESRREYVDQISWRLSGVIEYSSPDPGHPQYFPECLFTLREDEVFVDCGAYDGDTLQVFLQQCRGDFRRALAFEPDPSNFARLTDLIRKVPEDVRRRITAHELATGAARCKVRFAASGQPSAAITVGGEVEVSVAPLDQMMQEPPTYIKMDIEGAELDALAGARQCILKNAPILAVCAYHAQDHLWRVPLAIASMVPGYHLFLRRYAEWGFDTVCYAVPPHRLQRAN